VGLDLGAEAERVALSIVAELLAVYSARERRIFARRKPRSMQPERGGAVAGIVLAAGASTRMGQNKLL
jgi:hypothetical protein